MTDDANKTKCLRCNLNFTSEKTLKTHQLEKHPQGVVKCFKCGLKFSNQERFRVHWNTKHVTAPKTPAEPKPSSDKETVVLDDDSESNSQASIVTVKKRQHVAPTSNRCSVCYKAFASQQFAKLHYDRVHKDWTSECEVCQKRVKKNLYINVHLAKHRLRGEISVERILQIQKENNKKNQQKKSSKPELNVKIQPNVPTPCPDCQKVFISDRVMKIHWARVHYVSARKTNTENESDNTEKANSKAAVKEPKACPQCNKVFRTDGIMRIHYFQAHVKKTASKRIRKKKTVEKENAPCTTLPSIKSVSDLRSKPPDINFDSKTCPVCKKEFANNVSARKHFKIVHRKEESVKCPYPQCFSRYSTLGNLRTHFSNHHPKATLPKEFEARQPAKRQKVEDKNSTDENRSDMHNDAEKCEDTPPQSHQEDTKKAANETKAVKPNNPLLMMFEKMREKNAQCPVVPVKISTEIIEIEEDQSEDSGGCFTLDFEHCSVCSKNFHTQEAAMMHYSNKHPDEMQMCSECSMLIVNSRSMPYHFKTKHPTIAMPLYLKLSRTIGFTKELFDQFNLNKCTTCQQVFDSKGDSQRHYIEEHEQKFEICSICMRGFRSEATLLTHWAQHHAESKFVEFQAQTPMEVDDQDKNDAENAPENVIDSETENTAENASKVDDIPITGSDTVAASNTSVTLNATNGKSKRNKAKIYPFIKGDMCPICNKQFTTRKTTLIHYKSVHLKNGIECKMCMTTFANVDHLKAHWMQVHEDAPWMEPTNEIKELCDKTQNETEDESEEMMNNDAKNKNDSKDKNESITPKLNVVVSLVNIKDNLDSLSPEMRKQFLQLSKDMDKTEIDSHLTDNDEKVSDSGHGSTTEIDEEEASIGCSQNEPLDLSIQHDRSPTDDLPDQTLVKCETVNIKYESSADLVSSFDKALSCGRTKTFALANDSDIIVKDEITIEEPTLKQ